MPLKVQIAPSLLACDLTRLGDEVQAVTAAGADLLHLDVMDGHFVPNLTFGFPVIAALKKIAKLPIDAHLMIEGADGYLDAFQSAGCAWLSVHVEACPHLHRTLARIRELGMKAGVALNPGTPIGSLDAALDFVDYVLVMSVDPGFGGQSFIPGSFDRVREIRTRIGKRPVSIQIDGGIKAENAGEAIGAGADILVVGTGLFAAKDYGAQIRRIRGAEAATR